MRGKFLTEKPTAKKEYHLTSYYWIFQVLILLVPSQKVLRSDCVHHFWEPFPILCFCILCIHFYFLNYFSQPPDEIFNEFLTLLICVDFHR